MEGQCNEYEGEYKYDKKCGKGVFKWASGNIYVGSYKDDERNGYGEMRWTDGSVYRGEWVRGIQHGYGRMEFPDKTIIEGIFENNVFKGDLGIKNSRVPYDLTNTLRTSLPKELRGNSVIR